MRRPRARRVPSPRAYLAFAIVACLLVLPGVLYAGSDSDSDSDSDSSSTTAEVEVNCTDPDPEEHDNIHEALQEKADQLTIQISGLCQERVVISRSNVTLIGSDPAFDGITGPALDDSFVQRALVRVIEGRNVRLENLTLTASESRGFEATGFANVQIVNCRVVGNDFRGMNITDTAFVRVEDTVIANNGSIELLAFGSGQISCIRCTVDDDNGIVAVAFRTGIITFTDSTVSTGGSVAIVPVEHATISGRDTDVSAGVLALYASEDAQLHWRGGQVEGSIWADFASQVFLNGVTQTANIVQNRASEDSHFRIDGGTFVGDTLLTGFSTGTTEGSPTFDTVSCNRGGDLFCDGSETKSGSSCGLCP
jgi:hypothetical protein